MTSHRAIKSRIPKRYLALTKHLIHNWTIFLCSLDIGNVDDQCRGPRIKEIGQLVTSNSPGTSLSFHDNDNSEQRHDREIVRIILIKVAEEIFSPEYQLFLSIFL